jgi:membrane protein
MFTNVRILTRALRQWSANGDSRLGAALAYYTLFSIAPLLVIAINIAGIVYGEEAARGEVKRTLSTYIDPDTAGALQNLVESAGEAQGALWARLLSIGVLIYGALGSFVHLRTSLCLIWKLEPPHPNTIIATLLDYALALAMVLLTGVFLLGSLAAGVAVSILHAYMDQHLPNESFPWSWVELAVSLGLVTLLFAAIYRILSDWRLPWHYVAYGAVIASLLFTIGKSLLSYYFVYAGIVSVYGAAGSLVVFLIWVYYSSQTLFIGAELIQARRTRSEWLGKGSTKPEGESSSPRGEHSEVSPTRPQA